MLCGAANRKCVLGGEQGTASATLIWLDPDRLVADVRVRTGDELRGRILRFDASDPEEERCRSVGLAIATLSPPSPPLPLPKQAEPKGPAPSSPTVDRDHLAMALSPGGTTGVAGKWLFGGEARLSVPVRWLELTLATGATLERAEGPKVDTSLAWVSVGVRHRLWNGARGRAFLRIEGLLEQLHVELYQDDGVLHRYGRLPAGRIALDGELPAFGRAFFTPSFGIGARAGRTEVLTGAARIEPLAVLRGEVALGLGTRF